ncbi:hypothetical protein QTH91_14540 [Variovorax dokdonensis]|uniref:DUF4304 domain-containing protein n=1 Tax=Variovorax dokdonensis TaxID=344883 RepID=A0ABT7NCM5_9BURK|nr:hypothetical protein [Variovorax dokdonensis]MDM0045705.1 hypothetical protein [Variovorax dokdonensis]
MIITAQQLERLAREMLPLGQLRFRRNTDPKRLSAGVELVNLQGQWAMSIYGNVHNSANDVEIAIGPARLTPMAEVPVYRIEEWLEATRDKFKHGEHRRHGTRYTEGDPFLVGMKLSEAHQFLALLMKEILKANPWRIEDSSAPADSGDRSPANPSPSIAPRRAAIEHMVRMALVARDQSGTERISIAKDKEVRFASEGELQAHLEKLWVANTCAISKVPLDLSRFDPDLAPSLDRIDSSGHYEPGNLQVVARFINRWKSDDNDGNFARLLRLVRQSSS